MVSNTEITESYLAIKVKGFKDVTVRPAWRYGREIVSVRADCALFFF
jgi:hypothetical protein